MSKFVLLIFLLINCSSLFSQELISSAGGDNFSLGEVFIETRSTSVMLVSEGVHQPIISLIDIEEHEDIHITVYPNPTSQKLVLDHALSTVRVNLHDALGRLVIEEIGRCDFFDLGEYPQGQYTLTVYQEDTLVYRCKILIQR
jgi:hypothetical protein